MGRDSGGEGGLSRVRRGPPQRLAHPPLTGNTCPTKQAAVALVDAGDEHFMRRFITHRLAEIEDNVRLFLFNELNQALDVAGELVVQESLGFVPAAGNAPQMGQRAQHGVAGNGLALRLSIAEIGHELTVETGASGFQKGFPGGIHGFGESRKEGERRGEWDLGYYIASFVPQCPCRLAAPDCLRIARPRSWSNFPDVMRFFLRLFQLACLLAILAGGLLLWVAVTPVRLSASPLDFQVLAGSSARSAARQIADAGVGLDPRLFEAIARIARNDSAIKAGSYEIEAGITPWELLRNLTRGDVSQAELAFIEGWNFRQLREKLNASPDLRHDSQLLSDQEILQRIGAAESHPEGLFFPDTYHFSPGSPDVDAAFSDPGSEIVPTVGSLSDGVYGTEELTRISPLVTESHMAMQQIAQDTGGRAFYNANNLSAAVARGVADGTSYYTIGYYPLNKDWDGKFRKIAIKTERRGVRLRYRTGYYAFDAGHLAKSADPWREGNRVRELVTAIKDPLPSTGVAFWAHLIPPSQTDPSSYVEFLVDAKTISFAATGEKYECNLDYAVLTVTSNGGITSTSVKTVQASLPASAYTTVRKRGLPYRLLVKSVPEQGSLRLAVRDNTTGLIGTLTIPIPASSAQADQGHSR